MELANGAWIEAGRNVLIAGPAGGFDARRAVAVDEAAENSQAGAISLLGVLFGGHDFIGSSCPRVGDFRLILDRIEHAGEDLEAQMLFVA